MSRWDRLLIALLGGVGRLLLATLRLHLVNPEEFTRIRDRGQPLIVVTWHSRLLLAMLPARVYGVTSLASPTRDGQIGARLGEHLGVASVVGDARYRGTAALRQLAKLLRRGQDLGLFPDGPSGPARRMKLGPLILARQVGCPILPIGLDAAWKVRLRSGWDEFLLPLPFSRVVAIAAEAVWVPKDATPDDLQRLAGTLEAVMDRLDRRAAELCQAQRSSRPTVGS